jgi:two-component system sensor histidine kinase BaeS
MFNTLRGRFALSHILPLLVVIPLLGIATIYLLEQQILIPSLLSELKGNALVLSRMAAREQQIWTDPGYASHLLTQGSFHENGRLMLLDGNCTLLASSEPSDANRIGTQIELPGVDAARRGQIVGQLIYSDALKDDIADALAPVIGSRGELLGFVRLSYHHYSLTDQIYQMRYLLTGILAAALLLGSLLGTVLAINVSVPIEKVTHAVYALVNGEQDEILPETGAREIRRLARSVNVLVERLRNLETARKRLLSNLVHEIGRPLGALRMAIAALSYGANRDPDFYAELLAGMDQETARLQRLLTDLSHLYEQSMGGLELDRQKIDLTKWLPETLSPWQQAALQKKLHWNLKVADPIPIIQADPLRLGQVIGNLVSNAIKFTPAGDSVTVEAGGDEKQVWVRVSDTGPGVPPEERKTLFAPFVRGQQGRRFPQGMGLGLSIARDLVEAHGGRIELESNVGQGATFTVWLPLNGNTTL